jgi:hypothetical protein
MERSNSLTSNDREPTKTEQETRDIEKSHDGQGVILSKAESYGLYATLFIL